MNKVKNKNINLYLPSGGYLLSGILDVKKNKIGIKKIYGLIVFMYIILIDIFKI
jgi:hypothetical protein